jgi:ADP-ribosylglycohydrolase
LDRYPWPGPSYSDEEADEMKRGIKGQEKSFRVELPRAKHAAKVDAQALRHACGMGFSVVDTVCFAIGVVEMHSHSLLSNVFETSVLEAVNGGGDADTNAAMVGAIVGAEVGIDGIPKRWIDGLDKRDMIIRTADELLDAALF